MKAQIGDVVAHSSDPYTYDVINIKGQVAFCSRPGNIKKQFIINELINFTRPDLLFVTIKVG